jgi:hypothetical protein
VNSPSARQRIHDGEAPTPHLVKIGRPDLPLKPGALVDHLYHEPVFIQLASDQDVTASMHDSVADQLGYHQLGSMELTFV